MGAKPPVPPISAPVAGGEGPAGRPAAQASVQLRFPASPWEVRAALHYLLDRLPLAGYAPDLPGTLEIVMAEVLNNVVEHAYGEEAGMIELEVSTAPGGLRCRVIDFGRPLNGAGLPVAHLPTAGSEGPPEGGFGWFLISALAQDISYLRVGRANWLSFSLAADEAAPAATGG